MYHLLDPFYSGILAGIIALWLLGFRPPIATKLAAGLKKRRNLVSIAVWSIFFLFAAAYVLNFGYFEDIHDIDDAVDAGYHSLKNGINPYKDDVIPRFKEKYSAHPEFANGTYNYMPLDLLVYYTAGSLTSSLGKPLWFVLTNLIFAGAAFYILQRLLKVRWTSYLPAAGIVMLFYSFDNASLTLLLMISSLYARERLESRSELVSIFLMGLATLTKVYAAIPFAIMLLFDIESKARSRDWRKMTEPLGAAVISAVVGVVVMVPFGFSSVLNSAVLFHASAGSRIDTASGGTLLSELIANSQYFAVMSFAMVLIAVLVSFRFKNLNDRVLLVTAVFLLVSAKSSLAPLTVAGLFLVMRLRDRALARKAKEKADLEKGHLDSSPALSGLQSGPR